MDLQEGYCIPMQISWINRLTPLKTWFLVPILKDQDESVDRFVCCQENAEKPQHHLIALTVRADVFFFQKIPRTSRKHHLAGF